MSEQPLREQLTAQIAALYRECVEASRKLEPPDVWRERLARVQELEERAQRETST
jgi:hypothetical protein